MAHTSLISLPASCWRGDDVPITAADAQCGRKVVQGAMLLAFDASASEAALSQRFQMPAGYTGAGVLKADVWVMFASEITVTDEAVFAIRLEAVTTGDALDLDAGRGFDTENSFEVDPPGTAGYATKTTVTLTNKDSVAAGDMCQLNIRRDHDAGADTATGDAYVLLVELWEDV